MAPGRPVCGSGGHGYIAAFVMATFFTPSLTALIGHAAWWPGNADRAAEAPAAAAPAGAPGAARVTGALAAPERARDPRTDPRVTAPGHDNPQAPPRA